MGALRVEEEGESVVSRILEGHEKRTAKAREGLLYGARPAEGTLPLTVRVVGRGVGYTFLLIATFMVSSALGASLAVVMEYLVGWPDTWWL